MFLFVFSILSRRCPLLATFLSVLFCLLSLLICDSWFDLVWFRLSCDHGWIRSGSVNVRKTTTTTTIACYIPPFVRQYSACSLHGSYRLLLLPPIRTAVLSRSAFLLPHCLTFPPTSPVYPPSGSATMSRL